MPAKHILVVEDERHLAMGIKFNLEAEGYRVTTIGDGPAALKHIEESEAESESEEDQGSSQAGIQEEGSGQKIQA